MPFDSSPRTDLGGDVVIINEPPGSYAPAFARRGAVSRGKERTTIEIISEPLLFDLDELALGQKPALAIQDALKRGVQAITEFASAATIARRKAAADNPNTPSVARRYSGGRTGFKPPNQTARLFNDSGRLAEGFFVRENKEDRAWTVNTPANRLDPSTFTGSGFERMLDRLRSLVPILQDARALLADKGFNAAVSEAVKDLVTRGEAASDASTVRKLQQLAAARKRLARAALAAARAVLG